MRPLEARIGDIVFRGDASGQADPASFYLSQDGFVGWDDGTDTRRDETVIPQGFGSFDTPGFGAARVISFSGNCIADSPERLVWAGNKLTGLLAGGEPGRLVVERDGLTTWADVRRVSKTQFAARGFARFTATFQIQFWARDPRRYGDTYEFVDGTAWHFGNFPAAPVYTVTGSAPGYIVTGPDGQRYTVTHALVAGHPHTIDMATGYLSIDGAVQFGSVTQADTWTIPPGTTIRCTVTPTSGTATITSTVVDTYV